MIYLFVLIHLLWDKILISQKYVTLKAEKPEYIFVHSLFYALAFAVFKYGTTLSVEFGAITFLLIFLVRTIFDNLLSEIILMYKNKMVEGSNTPNIGYESVNVMGSFIHFLIAYYFFNYAK